MTLPNELLTTIFLYLHETTTPKPGQYSWTNICRVCRHWYRVAITFAPLWSKIPSVRKGEVTHVDHISLMVQRSRAAPLSICVDLTARVDTMRELVNQRAFDRVRSASFWWGILPPFTQDTENAAIDAPQLQEININGPLCWPARPTAIPLSLGNLPQLSTLRVMHCPLVDMVMPLCRDTITHLELSVGRLPSNSLYSLLNRMPNLEFLSFTDTISMETYRSQVYLRKLRKIRIVDDLSPTVHNLNFIGMPFGSIQFLRVRIPFTQRLDIAALTKKLVSLHPNPTISVLRIQRRSTLDLDVQGWTRPYHSEIFHSEPQFHITFEHSKVKGWEHTIQEFSFALRSTSSRPKVVSYVQVGSTCIHGNTSWIGRPLSGNTIPLTVLSDFPWVEYLEISLSTAYVFLQVLLSLDRIVWEKIRSCCSLTRRLSYWDLTNFTCVTHTPTRQHLGTLLSSFPNLKTLVVTDIDPIHVETATQILRDAATAASQSAGHSLVDVIVKTSV